MANDYNFSSTADCENVKIRLNFKDLAVSILKIPFCQFGRKHSHKRLILYEFLN